MSTIKEKIIEFIEETHMSTEEVADCQNKTGLIKGAKSIKKGNYCVGELQYVYGHSDTNWPIHEQIRYIEEGKVLFVDDIEVYDHALFGQLVTRYIINSKKAKAIVSKGLMRDIEGLLDDNMLVWCSGITPIGCYNKLIEPTDEILKTAEEHRAFYEGNIVVCDDSGVVMIGKENITEEFYQKLKDMKEQERIWFDCVDNRGWDTFDTVCLKKYKDE